MHAVIVGCGRVGAGVAGSLAESGHTVAVVDKNPTAFRRLPAGFSGRTVVGKGFDRDHLAEAGIDDADALAAVTNGDNSNIVVARVARETYGIERVVARIYDPRRAAIYERLGIPTIATVAWSTNGVLRHLLPEQPEADWVDPTVTVALVQRAIPGAWAGRPLSELEEVERVRLVALTRLGAAELPRPDALAQEGDRAWFAVQTDAVESLDRRLEAGASR